MTNSEKVAWIVIAISLAFGELILWAATHGWLSSTFWFANALVGAVLVALGLATGIMTLREESRQR